MTNDFTPFANIVQTIQPPRVAIVSGVGSFANNPHDLTRGLNLHSDDAHRVVCNTMHGRCPKQGAMGMITTDHMV